MKMPGRRHVWVTHINRCREMIAVLVKYGFVDVVGLDERSWFGIRLIRVWKCPVLPVRAEAKHA